MEALESAIFQFCEQCQISFLSIKQLASIDVKANEVGLLALSQKYKLPFITYSAAVLQAQEGVFAHSDYVAKTVGVGNVCERSAVVASKGRLLVGKTTYPGITLALASEEEL